MDQYEVIDIINNKNNKKKKKKRKKRHHRHYKYDENNIIDINRNSEIDNKNIEKSVNLENFEEIDLEIKEVLTKNTKKTRVELITEMIEKLIETHKNESYKLNDILIYRVDNLKPSLPEQLEGNPLNFPVIKNEELDLVCEKINRDPSLYSYWYRTYSILDGRVKVRYIKVIVNGNWFIEKYEKLKSYIISI